MTGRLDGKTAWVTGAGRSESDSSLLRAVETGGISHQGATAPRATPSMFISLRNRYCG